MKQVLLLFKIQFLAKYRMGKLYSLKGSKTRQNMQKVGLYLLLAFSFGSLLFSYCLLLDGVMVVAVEAMDPGIVIDMVVLAAMSLCALFGIFVVISNIYLPKDAALLAALPIRDKRVFLSKFLLVYLTELGIAAVLFVPAIIIYGIRVAGTGIFFYLRALYVLLLLPAVPLLVAVLFVSVMMLFITKIRRRELVVTIGSFVLMAILIFGQMYLNTAITRAMEAGDGLAGLFDRYWPTMRAMTTPPASWASAAIYGGGYTSLLTALLFSITVLISFLIAYSIAGAIYRNASRAMSESAKTYKKERRGKQQIRVRKPYMAVYVKEWKLMLRSSIYASNGLAGGIIVLILVLMPMLGKGDENILPEIIKILDKNLIMLILTALIGLFSSLNLGATTAMSREGKAAWLIKAMPLPYADLIWGKLLFGATIPLVWALPLALAAVFVLKASVLVAAGGLVLGMLLSFVMSAAGLLIDFIRPKLNWLNEAEPMKQNMNGLLSMALGTLFTVLFGFGGFVLIFKTNLELWAVNLILWFAVIVSAASVGKLLFVLGAKALEELEV